MLAGKDLLRVLMFANWQDGLENIRQVFLFS